MTNGPQEPFNPFQFVAENALPPERPANGKVQQVAVLSILSIIQSSLIALYGLMLVGLAVVFPLLVAGGGGSPDPTGILVVRITYGVMAAVMLVIGGFGIYAGIRLYRFRGRTMHLVVLWCGLASILTCYCLPTAIGLLVFGLIVLRNPQVIQACAMADAGASRDDILRMFSVSRSGPAF